MLHTLANGLKTIVCENHAAPVVAIQVWVDVGSADEDEREAGIAHVLEHMVFKGTIKRGVGDIAKEIEAAGGDINAWTSFDQTVYHVTVASRNFGKGLDVLSDAVQNMRVDDKELLKELQVVREEIREGVDSPGKVASRELFRTAFRRHPYGRPVIGYDKTVSAFRKRDVETFYRRMYTPQRMTVVIVGDVDKRQALAQVQRMFGKRRGKAARPNSNRAQEPAQRSPRLTTKRQAAAEAHLALAFHIPAVTHEDTPALDLAAVILGHGDSGRLSRTVRRELQLVNDIYAYAYSPRDPGLLLVGAAMPADKVAPAVKAIADQIKQLGQQLVSPEELARAKTIVEADAVYQRETVQGYARQLGFFQANAGDPNYEDTFIRRAASVTATKLKATAQKYLDTNQATISLVSPRVTPKLRNTLKNRLRCTKMPTPRRRPKQGKALETQTEQVRLDNGARLLLQRDASVPLVAMRAVWLGGLRYERSSNNGINSLLAALVTRGTATRSADAIHGEIESMAGSIGGFSGRNSFGIRMEILGRYWERGLDILADCAKNSAFPDNEVEQNRAEALEEIRAQDDNLAGRTMRLFARTLYSKHPYRLNLLGSSAAVAKLEREGLRRYYNRHFCAPGLVLSAVGDVEVDALRDKFVELFAKLPKRSAPEPKFTAEPQKKRAAIAKEAVDREQAHIIVGFPGTTLHAQDRFALEVMTSILSGQGGRLFVELRDRLGLAYSVSAFSLEGLEPGYIAAYMATSPQNIDRALSGFTREFDRLKQKPVGATELARVKRYLIGTHEIAQQRRATIASHLAFSEVYGLGHRTHLEYPEHVATIDAAAVQAAAVKYLDDDSKVVAIVHPRRAANG